MGGLVTLLGVDILCKSCVHRISTAASVVFIVFVLIGRACVNYVLDC